MVVPAWHRIVGYSAVLIALVAIVGLLTPRMVGTRTDPHIGLVRDAIVAYQVEKGKFADSLVQVEDILKLATRTDCQITRHSEYEYTVEMPLQTGKTYYMDIAYGVSGTGEWEKFDARITDIRRSR